MQCSNVSKGRRRPFSISIYQPALFLQPRAWSGVVVGSGTRVGTVVGSGTGTVVGRGVGAVVGSGVGAVVGSRDGMVIGSGIGTVVGSGR